MNISMSSVTGFAASAAIQKAAMPGVMELGVQAQFIRKDPTLTPAEKDAQLSVLSRQAKQAVALATTASQAAVHSTLVDAASKTADAAQDITTSQRTDSDRALASIAEDGSDRVGATYTRDGTQDTTANPNGRSIGAVVDVQA